MKIKRLTALLLTGVLAASFTLGGCGSKEVDPETVVATLNGKEIKLGLANFMAQYQAVTYDAYYSSYMGANMWSQDYSGDGKTMEDMVKDQVMESIETDYLLEDHMADYNVEITDEELSAMKDAAAQFMEANKQPGDRAHDGDRGYRDRDAAVEYDPAENARSDHCGGRYRGQR